MGSRLSFLLSEFLLNEYAEIHLTNHRPDSDDESEDVSVEAVARVIFHTPGRNNVTYDFDVYTNSGVVTLSCDFNYIRYEEGSPQREMFRRLYEAGINFTVTH